MSGAQYYVGVMMKRERMGYQAMISIAVGSVVLLVVELFR